MTIKRKVFGKTEKAKAEPENFKNDLAKLNNGFDKEKVFNMARKAAGITDNQEVDPDTEKADIEPNDAPDTNDDSKEVLEKRKPGRPPSQITIAAVSEVDVKLPDQTLARFKRLIEEAKLTPIEDLIADTGRPMKYRPIFCVKIIEEMAQGKSKETVATELGITYQSFYNWAKKYSDFHYAVKVGEQLSKRWWLEQGRLNLSNKNFNHVLWMMNMTNMHDWASSNSKVNAQIDVKETKRVEIEYNSSDSAEILEILHNSGAIKLDKSKAIDAEVISTEDKDD